MALLRTCLELIHLSAISHPAGINKTPVPKLWLLMTKLLCFPRKMT